MADAGLLSCITMNVVRHIAKQDNVSLEEITPLYDSEPRIVRIYSEMINFGLGVLHASK